MSNIGPAIPAHLLAGRSAAQGDSDDEDTGPMPAPPVAGPSIPRQVVVGPSRPPPAPSNDDESDDDNYGPALPPDLIASRSAPAPAAKKISGPSFPTSNPYADDSDDDDVGPMPLPEGNATQTKADAIREFMEKEERRRKQVEEAAKPKALQRDEWMLVPPTNSGILGSKLLVLIFWLLHSVNMFIIDLDTTKLKARTFARTTAPPVGKVDNSLWTELPAERAQRIADEVAGVKRRATAPADALSPEEEREARKRQKRDEDIRRGVDRHTREMRGGALVDVHEEKVKEKKDEEKDKGIWDHGRDMGFSGRLMDEGARKKMLQDAKGLGDRFGTGTSGGFL